MYKSGFRWLMAITFVLSLVITSGSSASAATGDGSPGDANITYIGRWDKSDLTNVKSYWSGAYFRVNFTGTTLSIKLGAPVPIYVTIDGTTTYYPGANGTVNLTPAPLASGTHSLRVAARSEYDTIQFKGLVLSGGASTQAPAAKSKLIEFIGDSITAGCCTLTNWALNDYSWLTGEALNADHTQVAYSGICLQHAANCGENNIGMSVQFFKLQTIRYLNSPAWDFNRYQASQVVVNLGTNDWNTPDSTFQSTYTTFLQNVRAKYPNADIYVLRTFGGYKAAPTLAAVNARRNAGDTKVHYVDTTGWVTSGDFDRDNLHPNMNGHIKIANRLTAVLGGTPTPTPTPGAFPVAGTYYRLINRNSGKVAEVANFATADGGNVQQWSWTGTSSQQWRFVSVGGGYYNVINRNSGKCLDVSGVSTADGANVQQWTCGSGTNQRWQLVAVGGYYQLKAQHSGKVLDVVGNGTANGVNIDQWPWNGGANQQWQIVP